MSKSTELTSVNFKAVTGSGVAFVDFWAEWCGPCRAMGPVIDEIAELYAGKVTVGKINVDNEGALAEQFGVSSIPTLIVMKDGKEFKRFVGMTPKGDLAKAIDAACA